MERVAEAPHLPCCLKELKTPEQVPLATDYASVTENDVLFILQHSGLDSGAADIALRSTIAKPAD